jgi:DNA polymerase III sliding clamp (beta) subunit (PCNA family)
MRRPLTPKRKETMHATDLKKEGLSQALKACKTLLLFQATDTPLLLEANSDGLVLSATGGGALVRTLVPGKVEEEGSAVIDLNHLMSLHLTGKTTSFKSTKKLINVRSGRGLYKVGSSVETVKPIKMPKPGDRTVEIQAAFLRAAIRAIWFKHDDSGTGDIRIVFGKGQLRTETADEFRGVMYRKPMPGWKDLPLFKAVLPKKSADAIIGAFDPNDTLWLEVTATSFRMYSDDCYVAIPLVTDSDLPNVASMLKEQMGQLKKTTVFHVNADDLSKMTKSATSVLDKKDTEKLAAAQTFLTVKDGKFVMKTDGDIGSFQTQVPYDSFKGKEAEFVVLSKNLADLVELAKNSGEDISVEVWGEDLVMLRNVQGDYRSIYAFPQVRV